MKIYSKLIGLAALVSLGFTSCSKDNEHLEMQQGEARGAISGLTMVGGIHYKEVKEFNMGGDEARAVVTRTHNDLPNIYLRYGLTIRSVVYSKNGTSVNNVKVADVATKHSNYNLNTNMGTGYTILNNGGAIADNDFGNRIAVTVAGDNAHRFNYDDYAYMVIGGIVLSSTQGDEKKVAQCFGYPGDGNRYNDPNKLIPSDARKNLVLATEGSEVSLPFPLTTKVSKLTAANKERVLGSTANNFADKYVNWVKLPEQQFDARGSLLGFKIINNTGFKVEVVSLETRAKENGITPFSTKGYFTPVGMNYVGDTGNELKYVSEENIGWNCKIVDVNGRRGFDLEPNASTNGRFFYWGYPVEPTKALYVRLKYYFYNLDGTKMPVMSSLLQKIPAPGAWADGGYYRINLKLKKHPNDSEPGWETIEFCDPNNTQSTEPNLPTDYELEGVLIGNKY